MKIEGEVMFLRSRRLREGTAIRDLVRETELSVKDFIFPIFVVEGQGIKREISSIPNNYHYSIDQLEGVIKEVTEAGVAGVIIFGIPNTKDHIGSSAFDDNGIVQRAVRRIKELNKELFVITDVCMCQYTYHGHCGVLKEGKVDNDASLEYIAKIALSHGKAGADMVAPSDMMDGRVQAIRSILDENHLTHVGIMSYSAKYASAFYGPFREAA